MNNKKINKNYVLAILNKEIKLTYEEGLKLIEEYCIEHHKNKQQIDLFLFAITQIPHLIDILIKDCLDYYRKKFNICYVSKLNIDTNQNIFTKIFDNNINQIILFYY